MTTVTQLKEKSLEFFKIEKERNYKLLQDISISNNKLK